MGEIFIIALYLVGIAIGFIFLRSIGRGIYVLLHKTVSYFKGYCGRYYIGFVSWWHIIFLIIGTYILFSEKLAFDTFLISLEITNPITKLIIGCVIVGIPLLNLLIKAGIHSISILIIQLIGIPLYVLYGIFGIICSLTGGLPESTYTYVEIGKIPAGGLKIPTKGTRINEGGETRTVIAPKGDSYYGDDGRWHNRDNSHRDGMDHYN